MTNMPTYILMGSKLSASNKRQWYVLRIWDQLPTVQYINNVIDGYTQHNRTKSQYNREDIALYQKVYFE